MPEGELRVIKSICAISESRARSYKVSEPQGAELQLVNADDADALTALQQMDPEGSVPTVYLSADGRPLGTYSLRRPVQPAALLQLLDQVSDDLLQRDSDLASARSGPPSLSAAVFHALVVDESPSVRQQLEVALAELGGDVEGVDTGERALAMLEGGGYDMVFLDVVLPGADGYQICKTIKRNPRHKDLPVVMLTNRSSALDKVRGSLAGCDAYLTKPTEIHTLHRVIERFAPRLSRTPA